MKTTMELDLEALRESDLECLNSDFDLIPLDSINENHSTQVRVDVKGGPSFDFLEEDESFMKLVAQGGANPSAAVDKWARNRLDKFRKFVGLSTDVTIEHMSEANCSTLLTRFFAQVLKKNGQLYPTATLMGLYRAFNRILRRAQEVRVQQTGINEVPFTMRSNPMFKQVEISCVASMGRSRAAGANIPRKKSAVISLADEKSILTHACTNVAHPRGLQARCIFYLLCRFAIRGGQELYNLDKAEFQFGVDDGGKYVRYDERLSKNYRVSLDRYQEEHFREAVTSHDQDMVTSLETLISHLPVSGTFLFYQCIDNPRSHAWYSTLRVSAKKLSHFMRMLHSECGLGMDSVTNKSGRTTCVTRMAAEGVPPAIGMRITGHKSQGAYTRYDRSLEAQARAAQKCAAEGSSYGSNIEVETAVFKNKVVEGDREGPTKISRIGSCSTVAEADRVGEADAELHAKNRVGEADAELDVQTKAVAVKPVAAEAANIQTAVEGVNIQTTQEYDRWADMVNWEAMDRDLASRGLIVAKSIVNNQVTAVFGKIHSMSNCNITINFGSNNSNGTDAPDLTSFIGSI